MAFEPMETAESHAVPTVRQQSIFLENRVGQLHRLTQVFEQTDIRIIAVSIVHSVDCAICRMILDEPDLGYKTMTEAGWTVSEAELLVVNLPLGKRALLDTWAALLGAEVSIYYVYPLLIRPNDCPAIAIFPDDVDAAARVLRNRKFRLIDEIELREYRRNG